MVLIQRVGRELGLVVNDANIRTAPARLQMREGRSQSGHLLAFASELVFYARRRLLPPARGWRLRLFLKDMTRVSSAGDRLSIFIAVDRAGSADCAPGPYGNLIFSQRHLQEISNVATLVPCEADADSLAQVGLGYSIGLRV